jgi:predicted nucleic acid-binding protein
MRVLLDANVLFSAASGRSPGFRRFWDRDGLTVVTSVQAAGEAHRHLPDPAREALGVLLAKTEVVPDGADPGNGASRSWNLPDPTDVPILLSAIRSRCDCFVSGDNHFKQLFGQRVEGVLVLRPASFLAMLDSRG